MNQRNANDGARRVLYDAMVLSASLRAVRDCPYYQKEGRVDLIDATVEAHHIHALLQIRSMIDFLTCHPSPFPDTITAIQFFGCSQQEMKFEERRMTNKYAAHKSWDAASKNAAAGGRQLKKPEVVKLGLKTLAGFRFFWDELHRSKLPIALNPNAQRYLEVFEDNWKYLDATGA